MSREIEDTLDAMVNTIEGISKLNKEMAECMESLDKRISALEQKAARINEATEITRTMTATEVLGSRKGKL